MLVDSLSGALPFMIPFSSGASVCSAPIRSATPPHPLSLGRSGFEPVGLLSQLALRMQREGQPGTGECRRSLLLAAR